MSATLSLNNISMTYYTKTDEDIRKILGSED